MEHGSEDKLTFISGDRFPKSVIKSDRFSLGNVFYRAAQSQDYNLTLIRDVTGARGGIKPDILSVWVSDDTAQKLDQVYQRAQGYSAFYIARSVENGRTDLLQQLLQRPEFFYSNHPFIQFGKVYDPEFIEQCYMRSYRRSQFVYEDNLGRLSVDPQKHEPLFIKLLNQNVKQVVPKRLQQSMAHVIETIVYREPHLAP